ncbi:hypothetical protein ECTT12B_4012, partial [Escherichia coli TT12B]
SRTVQ